MSKAIDTERLYQDLRTHFGILCTVNKYTWASGALAVLDTYAYTEDWDGIINIALNEGFDMEDYTI